jgi:hypothetical protein
VKDGIACSHEGHTEKRSNRRKKGIRIKEEKKGIGTDKHTRRKERKKKMKY